MNLKNRSGPSKTAQVVVQSDKAKKSVSSGTINKHTSYYHQLANDSLIEIFRPSVNALRDQVTSIDMFIPHTPFPFLKTSGTLFL
jgi:endonuclease IV